MADSASTDSEVQFNTRIYNNNNNVMETARDSDQPDPDHGNDQSVSTVQPTFSNLQREAPLRHRTPSSSPERLIASPNRIPRTVRPSSSFHRRSFSRSPSIHHQSRYSRPSRSPSPIPRRPSSSTKNRRLHAYSDQIAPRDQGDFHHNQKSHRSRPTTPCLKPESYSGSQNWEEYHSHFEDCAELSDWDSHNKVLFLAASLRGPARSYYMSLDSSEKRNYSSLISRMRQRFGSIKHSSKWLSELESRQRGPGESITALGDELRQLAKKAYGDLDTTAQETLALNQLYKLIPVEMKCRCIDSKCENVYQAVDIIERYEAILGDHSQELKKSNIRAIDTSGIDTTISNLFQKLDSRLEKMESIHLVHQNNSAQQYRRQSGPQNYNRERRCYECNAPDHFRRDCPQFQRNMNRYNPQHTVPNRPTLTPPQLVSGNGKSSTQ